MTDVLPDNAALVEEFLAVAKMLTDAPAWTHRTVSARMICAAADRIEALRAPDDRLVEALFREELATYPLNGSFANGSLALYADGILKSLHKAGGSIAALSRRSTDTPPAISAGEADYRTYCESREEQPEGTREALLECATMLEEYGIAELPANEHGQVDFMRALMESVVGEIRAYFERSTDTTTPPEPSEASEKLGAWMSAALDDPDVCEAMKADIREWFSAGEPLAAAPNDKMKALVEANGWQDIASAPLVVEVEVRVGAGMVFRATLRPDASMRADESSCDQWLASVEGEHPPCWSGGACWESNEDEVRSLQPNAWRPLPAALALARSRT